MKTLALLVGLIVAVQAPAAFIEIKDATEFNELISQSTVPVVVQFSAYWCGPCKTLTQTMHKVAENYTDDQVRIAKVDAYVNSSLQKYLQGGYPTVRTFKAGYVTQASFTGVQSESYVTHFIDQLINGRNETFCPIN